MTQRFKRLSHSLYECKYHIVFCPKYRYRILKEAIGEYVRQQVYQLCKQKEEIEVLVMNIQPDHVHLVVSIPPKYAVSAFMGYLKGKLALCLFQQYESLGRRYWGRHLWARGYCVSTIGLDEEKIRKYVQWQETQEKQTEIVQGKLFE
ncbi:MAG: IS200/IS605 family transposase [Anaerolineales bacterium]|nr:IS200/IS605 family transposase [Anaerolineales bacterium]